tara:strand:+ start:3618 stop:3776 length:159 start_codon:yes stop_codon:yes gene_type:complete
MKQLRTLKHYTQGEILNKQERERKKNKKFVEKHILTPWYFNNKKKEDECLSK